MTTTACGSKKNPSQTQGSHTGGHNYTTESNAAALVAALKKGPNGSFRLALTTSEAAAALGISVRTLHRLSSERNLIKPSRVLRTMVWPVTELVRFLEQTAA